MISAQCWKQYRVIRNKIKKQNNNSAKLVAHKNEITNNNYVHVHVYVYVLCVS